jgi:hypothetical protein
MTWQRLSAYPGAQARLRPDGRRIVVSAGQHALGGAAMDDILSQGRDREPSPRRRRLAMIVALTLVVAGGAVYLGLSRPQHAPAAAHQAPVTVSPALVPSGSAALNLPPEPDGIAGQTLAWDRNLRLPVGGTHPVWFSPASGRSDPIGGLPADRSGYQFIRVVGGWAVQASPASPTQCGSCAGPPTPVWFLADGARSVTRVGTANLVAAAATADALWLTTYAPGADMTITAGTAREVGPTGTLTRPVRLPAGYSIDQGTDRGLLLAPVRAQSGVAAYKLWDPSAPRASRTFDGVLAASPGEIAWAPQCVTKCDVQALDLATGRRTVVALPAGSSAVSGAFSPDGRFLALQVSYGNTGDGGDLAMQLDVAPVTSGRLAAFGWPTGGDSLVAEFSFTTKTQLASWHPGAKIPAVTVIQPGPNQASLILG